MTFELNNSLMGLRSNSILKYFIIVLFSFELLAPAFMPRPLTQHFDKTSDTQYSQHGSSLDYLTAFLFEESSSEEREGKDYVIEFLFVTDIFNELMKFEHVSICRLYAQDQISSQPSLYTLQRVLRI